VFFFSRSTKGGRAKEDDERRRKMKNRMPRTFPCTSRHPFNQLARKNRQRFPSINVRRCEQRGKKPQKLTVFLQHGRRERIHRRRPRRRCYRCRCRSARVVERQRRCFCCDRRDVAVDAATVVGDSQGGEEARATTRMRRRRSGDDDRGGIPQPPSAPAGGRASVGESSGRVEAGHRLSPRWTEGETVSCYCLQHAR